MGRKNITQAIEGKGDFNEPKIAVKFCVKLGKSLKETHEMNKTAYQSRSNTKIMLTVFFNVFFPNEFSATGQSVNRHHDPEVLRHL
jgi:hypothetical protein